jgi:Predicted Zn-dependent protease
MVLSNQMIWIIMIAVMVLSMIIQGVLKSRFSKYSEVPLSMTGAEVASRMLQAHGIRDVQIVSIQGKLTDHYDPTTRTVNLSEEVYFGRSVAAAAVAAHECGHVIQHSTGYAPLKLRTALVPVVTFSNSIVSWVLLAGVIFINVFPSLLWIGIGLFALTTLFSFVTLPVEINASSRAVKWLDNTGIVSYETKPMAVDALRWAAYTYVIAALGSLATLLYYISLSGRRN